jgi:uncharacterized membrane protein
LRALFILQMHAPKFIFAAMTDEPVLLDATLRPSLPMDARALKAILIVVALFNLAFALSFVLRGAWPVAPFMGLDVALLAWAFRASIIASKRFEQVTVTPSVVRVEQHPPKGTVCKSEFNAYWVRVDLQQVTEHSNRLFLRSHGRELQIGAFLAPAVRESFANTLKLALSAAKADRF